MRRSITAGESSNGSIMPKIERCVRCGGEGRYMGSFLDQRCYSDPKRISEQREVESVLWGDPRAMRQMLVAKYKWFGWSKPRPEGM